MSCGPRCWTAVKCSHGYDMPPKGRSVALEAYTHDCDEEHSSKNTMHLFSAHDSTRWYHDKEGWEAHERACEWCNPQDDDA